MLNRDGEINPDSFNAILTRKQFNNAIAESTHDFTNSLGSTHEELIRGSHPVLRDGTALEKKIKDNQFDYTLP